MRDTMPGPSDQDHRTLVKNDFSKDTGYSPTKASDPLGPMAILEITNTGWLRRLAEPLPITADDITLSFIAALMGLAVTLPVTYRTATAPNGPSDKGRADCSGHR